MANDEIPKVSAFISLDRTTHSYSNPEAPNLKLTITSAYRTPITIYADDLSPKLMLACGGFIITDLSSGCEVKQTIRTHCRIPPPSQVSVPLQQELFQTLPPNTPITFSTPFTRLRPENGGKPLSKDDAEYGSDRTARFGACGVDGLEAGQRYALTLTENPRIAWSCVRWWDHGTKEQVLHPERGSGLDGREVQFGKATYQPIRVDYSQAQGVLFECTI